MKYILIIAIVLFSHYSFSQTNTKILIVPLKKEMIEVDKHTQKLLNYNNVVLDTLKNKIINFSALKLKTQFPMFSFINLDSIIGYKWLADSLNSNKQWNTFQLKKIKDSNGLEKMILLNDDDPKLKYYGRELEENEIKTFNELIQKYDFKYIFFINRFETCTPKPFDRKTYMCLHLEIYDQKMNKIFGDKSDSSRKIYKKMYYHVFSDYYIPDAIESFYKAVVKPFIAGE
jgi:hypothetical protein